MSDIGLSQKSKPTLLKRLLLFYLPILAVSLLGLGWYSATILEEFHYTEKEKDLERLKFLIDKAIELNPESPDTYAARALIGLRLLNTGCESALNDMIKSEEIGSTVDTLTIGSACLLYTSPSPRDATLSRMPSSD